ARPRHARLRTGPDHGGAAWRRCRPHHLHDVCDRGGTRCGRGHDVPLVLRPGGFLHGLCRRHQGLHRGGARRHRVAARRDAGRPLDRPDRDAVVGVFLGRIQGRRGVLDPDHCPDLPPNRPFGPTRSRKSMTGARVTAAVPKATSEATSEATPKATAISHAPGVAFILKKALISALVALVLFSLMIGVRTEAGPTGQLIYWTRFDD